MRHIAWKSLKIGKERTVLALKPHISPIKVAVIPLKRNDKDIVTKSIELKNRLQSSLTGRVLLENTGNIGKSYRKHHEIGTPACITVDFQTLEDETITVRDRDSMDQKRVNLEEVNAFLSENYSI